MHSHRHRVCAILYDGAVPKNMEIELGRKERDLRDFHIFPNGGVADIVGLLLRLPYRSAQAILAADKLARGDSARHFVELL